MDIMCGGAKKFNQNSGQWNTSKATKMEDKFSDAAQFNQDTGGWDTSRVTTEIHVLSSGRVQAEPWAVEHKKSYEEGRHVLGGMRCKQCSLHRVQCELCQLVGDLPDLVQLLVRLEVDRHGLSSANDPKIKHFLCD